MASPQQFGAPQESILNYTQPIQPMPSAYYPAAAPYQYGYPYEESSGEGGSYGVTLALSIIVLFFVIWLIYYMSPARVLTRRLVKAGWVLYLRPGCVHCTRQEAILRGKFWKTVTCKNGKAVAQGYSGRAPVKCDTVKNYPYWHNTDHPQKSRYGTQSWKDLQAMAKMG